MSDKKKIKLTMYRISSDETFPCYAVDRSTMPAYQAAFVTKLSVYDEGNPWYFSIEGQQSSRGYSTAEEALAALERQINATEG